eukprot:m.118485 g.118485  ORF g.118485 m.118485 type:complete len:54 (+) comp14277_c1_seq23:2864-3025(+)
MAYLRNSEEFMSNNMRQQMQNGIRLLSLNWVALRVVGVFRLSWIYGPCRLGLG